VGHSVQYTTEENIVIASQGYCRLQQTEFLGSWCILIMTRQSVAYL